MARMSEIAVARGHRAAMLALVTGGRKAVAVLALLVALSSAGSAHAQTTPALDVEYESQILEFPATAAAAPPAEVRITLSSVGDAPVVLGQPFVEGNAA